MLDFPKNTNGEGCIFLRPLSRSDIDNLLDWENDHSLTDPSPYLAPLTRELVEKYIAEYCADPFATGEFRQIIAYCETGCPIGYVDLYNIDRVNLHAHIGIYICRECRGIGIAKKALLMLEDYCRNTLVLHQLIAQIAVDAEASRALFKAAGYKTCGRIRSYLRRGKSYADVIVVQKLF